MSLHCLLGITAQMTGMKCGGVCEDAEVVGRTVFMGGDTELFSDLFRTPFEGPSEPMPARWTTHCMPGPPPPDTP